MPILSHLIAHMHQLIVMTIKMMLAVVACSSWSNKQCAQEKINPKYVGKNPTASICQPCARSAPTNLHISILRIHMDEHNHLHMSHLWLWLKPANDRRIRGTRRSTALPKGHPQELSSPSHADSNVANWQLHGLGAYQPMGYDKG